MRARRAAVTNASAVKHFVARGVVDLAASVSDAPSSPAAWWSVRPWVPLSRHVCAGRGARFCQGAGEPALPTTALRLVSYAPAGDSGFGSFLSNFWVLSCIPAFITLIGVLA